VEAAQRALQRRRLVVDGNDDLDVASPIGHELRGRMRPARARDDLCGRGGHGLGLTGDARRLAVDAGGGNGAERQAGEANEEIAKQ
jgi:hypothetical protein